MLMSTVLKASCLAIYVLAVVGTLALPSSGVTSALQIVAVVLLAGNVLELLIAFKSVKRYPGPLVDSIALTQLFAFLQWKPLTRRA
jgi:hypothetical protein